MKAFLVSLMIMLTSLSAMAANVVSGQVVNRRELNEVPSYFFKASRTGQYLGYTIFRNSGPRTDQNLLIDFRSGRRFEIPGRFDPMFAHDDQTMVIPVIRSGKYNCGFYDLGDVLASGREAKPLFVDDHLTCVYQSIGLLSYSQERSQYRLVSEGVGLAMRDFTQDRRTKEVRVAGPGKKLCEGFNLKLPMVSKNGQELGAFDVDLNSSVILSIAENGQCTLKEKLNVWGGKMAFSADGRYVAVHVFQRQDRRLVTEFIEVPEEDHVADIHVYDRRTKKLRAITHNRSGNSLYPEFTSQGTVIFVHHPAEKSEKVQFVEVKFN